LKEMLKKEPEDSFLQHALAMELDKSGDSLGAQSLYQAILQRNPHYIGSYYQLGKSLEKTGDLENAKNWYKKGMAAAKEVGEIKAYRELSTACEELTD